MAPGDEAGTQSGAAQPAPPEGAKATTPQAQPAPQPGGLQPVQPPPQAVLQDRFRRELRRIRGVNIGAALYGWLVATGLAALLTAILAGAGAAIGLQQSAVASGTDNGATTLTVGGAILLVVVLVVAYYAGGYVAGRLSRFDGAVQGLAVWVVGVLVTVGLAIAGAIAGSQYNVLVQLRLPSIPVQGQSLVNGAVIELCIIAVLALVAAVLGGTVGRHYHSKVDRVLRGAYPETR